ncbi:MAG: hypothetical protein ITG02_02375 [Patulibacter sp.]|nr:hypothetical protein [Patulibacter sp.]
MPDPKPLEITWQDTRNAVGLIPGQLVGLTIAAVHVKESLEHGDELFVLFTNGMVASFCGDAGYNDDASCSRNHEVHDLAYFDVTDVRAGELIREAYGQPATDDTEQPHRRIVDETQAAGVGAGDRIFYCGFWRSVVKVGHTSAGSIPITAIEFASLDDDSISGVSFVSTNRVLRLVEVEPRPAIRRTAR